MIELGGTPKAAPASGDVIDGTDAGFAKDVIEASKTVPVIVAFVSDRSPACQDLINTLAPAVTAAEGRVKLVKLDIDKHQAYAEQLQIQSIPTVYAFFDAKPVDGFQGQLPPAELTEFVAKMAALGPEPDNGLDDAVAAAEEMLANGEAADAVETFAAILSEDGNHVAAYAGLVRAHLALGEIDEAEAVLNGAPAEISTDPALEAAHAQITLARKAAGAGPVDELTAKVDANPDDHQARLDLATALMANEDTQGAVDHLLELFRRDREWNEGAARAELFTIFDALPGKDPIALAGRRKLSSMIFV